MNITNIRTRNWQKARLTGFNLDVNVLTDNEVTLYKQILELKKQLLGFWDLETEQLIGHKLKPYKCCYCGKRSDVSYILASENYCYKHFTYFETK